MSKRGLVLIVTGSIIILAAAGYWFKSARQSHPDELLVHADSCSVERPVPRLYGIAIDSFTIEEGIVKRNQTLGQILQHYSLREGSMARLVNYTKGIFDVRKIRTGNRYTVFLSRDSLSQLQYMVYEHSPVDYVVFNFIDSLNVDLRQKEIISRQKNVYGKIENSLWETVTHNNINPNVALEMSEIYAWTIDFFGLQPEDSFSIIYDELYVDTVSVGMGEIHAAYFRHAGKDLYAIPFVQDSVSTFFDADGNSLRRAFLKAPLRFTRISSRYSSARLHPILRIVRPHYGVDYAAPVGTPVYAIGDGRIVEAAYQSGNGYYVKITHNSVYASQYMHLSRFGEGIKAGVYVKQGDLIGYVGSTGLSTGPHLDFRVYQNGSPIDPLKMESPPVDPVKPQNLAAFDSVRTLTIARLNEIGPRGYSGQDFLSNK
ncbi:MAG: peptidoglycan DD-metalloendopeptidase family protein [Bacteroidales bacterium]|nr:peptidoglycan DD-metalloendopeptidase family protein [Bacteroidales bacterium]